MKIGDKVFLKMDYSKSGNEEFFCNYVVQVTEIDVAASEYGGIHGPYYTMVAVGDDVTGLTFDKRVGLFPYNSIVKQTILKEV